MYLISKSFVLFTRYSPFLSSCYFSYSSRISVVPWSFALLSALPLCSLLYSHHGTDNSVYSSHDLSHSNRIKSLLKFSSFCFWRYCNILSLLLMHLTSPLSFQWILFSPLIEGPSLDGSAILVFINLFSQLQLLPLCESILLQSTFLNYLIHKIWF